MHAWERQAWRRTHGRLMKLEIGVAQHAAKAGRERPAARRWDRGGSSAQAERCRLKLRSARGAGRSPRQVGGA